MEQRLGPGPQNIIIQNTEQDCKWYKKGNAAVVKKDTLVNACALSSYAFSLSCTLEQREL